MLNIHFTCIGITDVCEFIERYSNLFPLEYQGKFRGEKSGVFTIEQKINGGAFVGYKPELNKIFGNQNLENILHQIENLVNENKVLKNKNSALENELSKLRPKQNLEVNQQLGSIIKLYRLNGNSFQQIANLLNENNFRNSRGNKLNSMQVKRLFDKQEKEKEAS